MDMEQMVQILLAAAQERGIPTALIRALPEQKPIAASEILGSAPPALPEGIPAFEYTPLKTNTSFRLLKILSEEGNDILSCTLFDADFDIGNVPVYNALSYTWNDPNLPGESCPILVNEKGLEISRNLWNFLQSYRCSTGEHIIWIDQICINQSDLDERAQQVRLMWKIYSKAGQDLFYIGEPDEYTEAAMDLVHNLNKAIDSLERRSNTPLEYPSTDMFRDPVYAATLGLPVFPSPAWKALMYFISRTAFQRSWIIQEVAVSLQVWICCGLLMFQFFKLGKAALLLVETSLIKAMHDEYPDAKGQMGFITGMFNCWKRHNSGEHQRMELLLASTRRFQSTDPVDKIFALANLSEPNDANALPPAYVADYRKSVEEVYRGVVLYSIEQGSLDILSGIEDHTLRRITTIPSWTPDFSVHQQASILCMPPRRGNFTLYAAASSRPAKRRWSSVQPNSLWLESYKVDKIRDISSLESATQDPPTRLEAFAQMVDFSKPYPSPNGERVRGIEAFWRTLVGNMGIQATAYPIPGDWVHHFAVSALEAKTYLSQLINFKSEADSAPPNTSTPGIDAILAALGDVLPMRDESGRVTTNASLFDWTMHHVSFFRRFFITESGYFGLALSSVEPGDEVVLFSGGRAPFIVRELEHQSRYQILGDCYVHGIMDGELLKGQDLKWEDLCFC